MVTSGATRVYLRHVPGFALGEVLACPRVDEVPATARSAKIFDDQAARKVVSQKHKKPEERAMDRRSFLTQAGAVAGVAATFPAPAIAQGARELKMVTSWPKGLPGLGSSAERLGRAITAITGGRVKVQVFGAGQLVSAFEVFDAVSSGVADMYHSAEDYLEKRSPGF